MWKQIQKKYLGSTIPVINVHGTINSECTEKVTRRLAKLSSTRASALAVSVNSPGGYPVQSQLICNKIKQYADKHHLKVYTFARDLAASGGYFVLCSGDKVYADTTSIVGSIGVVIPKYQFEGLLNLASLQNKQLTSNKQSFRYMLNPFHNLTPEEKEKLTKQCGWLHQKFINYVKKNRGTKLKNNDKIFTGEVFNGAQAKQLGLVDQVGSMIEVLEKEFPGAKIQTQQTRSILSVF